MEHYIIYDIATGAPLYQGSGQPGIAACQKVDEGCALTIVPRAIFTTTWPVLNLDAMRAMVIAAIDVEAEAVRARFLTPGSGQAMTYTRKEGEARAWTADPATATPFLVAEANVRGMTVAALAAEVIAQADIWVTIGAGIEAARMGAKAAVIAAHTLGAIVAARAVDWSGAAS